MPAETERIENIAQTLATELPKPLLIEAASGNGIEHLALPRGWSMAMLDNEAIMPNPRRAKAHAAIDDASSFIAYLQRYALPGTTVWCQFDPANLALSFNAVIDEHERDEPGWREHQARFTPSTSKEWKTWMGSNGPDKRKSQVDFAAFLENTEVDIASVDGMPSSGDMMRMALDFEAKADLRVKSKVALQNGGVAIEFVNDSDGATTEKMRVFEKFAIGIPVFWRAPASADEPVPAFLLTARLRYRLSNPPMFWYELIRPDLVHQRAAQALIAEIKAGIGDVPIVMGSSPLVGLARISPP